MALPEDALIPCNPVSQSLASLPNSGRYRGCHHSCRCQRGKFSRSQTAPRQAVPSHPGPREHVDPRGMPGLLGQRLKNIIRQSKD
ncbi:hypothetical protein SKAU_G00083070 [Synaphobranchus kaupii]|uniref:Uncharacterized protein n=1 Tax=Synaphobranchus kaupii TaxID=118154 RepID=A0A9Q1FVQ0_SYNKA|nr:hypothetical protein SKAU_G00083070 [Synaphobranchus kaupii]